MALDVTPLVGAPTGIHQVTRGLLDALAARDDVDVHGWLLTARGRTPAVGVPVRASRIPASLAVRGWARSGFPPGRLVAGPADVVHGPNFVAPPSPRSVLSLQDMTPLTRPDWCEPAVVAMADAVRHAVRRGAMLHVSSNLVRDEAIDHFALEPSRVRLVHHAVTAPDGGDGDEGRRLAGSRYVLALGRVEKRKNLVAAVTALEGLDREVRLVVAGPPGNDEERLTATIERAGPGRVVRLPSLDDPARSALLRGAEALLWPSRYEGFALPPLEALSVGTPIVATAVGALPELVGDTIDLLPPNDDDAFAHAVVETLADRPVVDPGLRARLTRHTWAEAAEQMTAVYRDTADRAG